MGRAKRLEYVESIRGLACLMLIAFHVTGSTPFEGLGLHDMHPLRLINDALDNTRMPVFAFISGFVVHAMMMSTEQLQKSIWSKARRLLIPMAAVSTLHYLLRSIAGADQQPFYSIYVTQYAHFWFLQASFILTSALLVLSYRFGGNSQRAALVLAVVMTPIFIFATRWNPNVFSMYQGFYLAPFFFCGHLFAGYLKKRGDEGKGPLPHWVTALVGVVFVASFTWNFLWIYGAVSMERPFTNIHRIVVGLASAMILFLLKPNTRFLVWVGSYTYVIYLFHVIFTAGTRDFLELVFPQVDPAWFFVPGFAMGMAGPLAVNYLALKNRVTALLFLGIDLKPKPKDELAGPKQAPESG